MSATFEPPPILKNIQISGWAALLAASLGALAVGSLSYAAAIAIGGALGLGNFRGMDICFARVFRRENPRVKWWHHVIYGARFIVLLAAVAGALAWGRLPVIGVVIGLSAPVMGIVLFGAFALIKGEAATRA